MNDARRDIAYLSTDPPAKLLLQSGAHARPLTYYLYRTCTVIVSDIPVYITIICLNTTETVSTRQFAGRAGHRRFYGRASVTA